MKCAILKSILKGRYTVGLYSNKTRQNGSKAYVAVYATSSAEQANGLQAHVAVDETFCNS